MAQVDGAIGIGRAIVEDPARGSLAVLTDLIVEAGLLPGGEACRLGLRQIGLHGEVGARQGKGIFQGKRLGVAGWRRRRHRFSSGSGKTSLYPAGQQ